MVLTIHNCTFVVNMHTYLVMQVVLPTLGLHQYMYITASKHFQQAARNFVL